MSRLGAVEVGNACEPVVANRGILPRVCPSSGHPLREANPLRRFADGRVKFVLKCFDESRHEMRACHLGILKLLSDPPPDRVANRCQVTCPPSRRERCLRRRCCGSDSPGCRRPRFLDVVAISIQRRPQVAEHMVKGAIPPNHEPRSCPRCFLSSSDVIDVPRAFG